MKQGKKLGCQLLKEQHNNAIKMENQAVELIRGTPYLISYLFLLVAMKMFVPEMAMKMVAVPSSIR